MSEPVILLQFGKLLNRASRRLHIHPQDLYDQVMHNQVINDGTRRLGRKQSALNIAFQAVAKDFMNHPGKEATPRDPSGGTLLHWLAICNQSKLLGAVKPSCKEVLEVRNKDGSTPTMLAASCAAQEALDALLTLGADPEAEDKKGFTPLFIAAQQGYSGIISSLLKHGADPSKGISTPNEPLGAPSGATPLMAAALGDHLDAMDCLLKNGADPNRLSNTGEAPLPIAVKKGNLTAAQLLLESGARTEDRFRNGITPLYLAVLMNLPEMVALLLQHGGNPEAVCGELSDTPIARSIRDDQYGLFKMLREAASSEPDNSSRCIS